MNYQSFKSLQFEKTVKKTFYNFMRELRDSKGKKFFLCP